MINFRYHIVSLTAVFLALALGIVLGVTLVSGPAKSTIANGAEQDRRALQDARAELTRLNALNTYRDAWAERVRPELTRGTLTGQRVAVVEMPGAPARVVSAVGDAVEQAGGTVVADVEVNQRVYEADNAAQVLKVVEPLTAAAPLPSNATAATRFGRALALAVLSSTASAPDERSAQVLQALTRARLVSVADDVQSRATSVVVVTAPAAETATTTTGNTVLSHAQTEVALKSRGVGVVVAGPNSADVAGTDVLQLRSPGPDADLVSTVDVADLPSGVVTTVLALDEQRLGRQGHYGATGDAVAPELPVR